ncbi:TspO/MBR related protein [Ulvibacter sp. MAR_2010_11]|uniref:TspO/MBR family protein n=1 Tax=Ulvibacter sp. MAR_2010_11 TaxID=1250229 RepID=UPI000C2C6573|nr:TspO/MBR family protein [Ulvibacter sp. MAR_2010_11]PKA82045.1 TspO/MBR related protein [Ulvibacter sp. MAR_2010_11]
MIKRILLFLVLNFSALAIGGLFTRSGVASLWYQNLEKAPWTPPGWVFGAAWTFIMICFAIYMAYLIVENTNRKKIISLFAFQWILNALWNPVFFYFHAMLAGLIVITLLTLLITYFLFHYNKELRLKSVFILPYFIWILIATSLNAYILIMN